MEGTLISATEAAIHLDDYLGRVKTKGESFILTEDDLPVAELSPASGRRRATLGESSAAFGTDPDDPGFADDLEKVNQAHSTPITKQFPVPQSRGATWAEMVAVLGEGSGDPTFADDLEKVNRSDQIMENPWA